MEDLHYIMQIPESLTTVSLIIRDSLISSIIVLNSRTVLLLRDSRKSIPAVQAGYIQILTVMECTKRH